MFGTSQWRSEGPAPGGFGERVEGLFRGGNELVADESGVTSPGDGAGDGGIIELLISTQFVSSGNTGSMEVGEVIDVLADGGDHVSLHDLHVVDVVEKPEARMADLLAEGDSPAGVVALVIGVINLRVEELHDEDDVVLLREGENAIQSGAAVVNSLLV